MRFVKSLLLACTAAVMVAHASAEGVAGIVSTAIFFGEDTSDPDARGAEVFRDPRNHPVAVASVIAFSAYQTGFLPQERGVITDESVYANFMKKIATFPGLLLRSTKQGSMALNGSSDQLKEQIIQSIESEVANRNVVADSIVDALPLSLEDKAKQDWTVSALVLQKDEEGVKVDLIAITLNLHNNKTGQAEITPGKASVHQDSFIANAAFLSINADALGSRIETVQVQAMLDLLTTPHKKDDGELQMWLDNKGQSSCATGSQSEPEDRRRHRNLYSFAQWRMNM
ncbi:hypothetical protein BC939DRAFT_476057 [Gamsiella multidivaricata]|uniref:uncharacterized protein n=1 Tax=Gamsiella multidivaricata TaxID=101098 RepID=UPI00221F82B1|nr:uncharacterized protein BC939DRAFT_476057 [Gamsiella multidivaricata]KAI7825607.1 hypothetical protein BC939DRAFT_476057 [Gamsiella multidivaricata]